MCVCVCVLTAVTDKTRLLTVGYISPDLYTHSVSYFAEAPITHHDSKRVNVIWYCVVPHPDARTHQLRSLAIASGATWKVLGPLARVFPHRLSLSPAGCVTVVARPHVCTVLRFLHEAYVCVCVCGCMCMCFWLRWAAQLTAGVEGL